MKEGFWEEDSCEKGTDFNESRSSRLVTVENKILLMLKGERENICASALQQSRQR